MSLSNLNILVTAIGGDLGQAIVKALRLNRYPLKIYGCDVEPTCVGSAFVDSYHIVPLASKIDDYLCALSDLCKKLKLHAIIPACEPEINVLCRLNASNQLNQGTAIICQDAKWIDIYGDKLKCMQALDGKIDLVPFADGNDDESVAHLVTQNGFPLVVKSRHSSGSRTLHIAKTREQLLVYIEETPFPLIQKFIDAVEGEFSIGFFSCSEFNTIIAFKRKLGFGGSTSFAETSDNAFVLNYAKQIANVTNLHGSANIQVRISSEGVRLLEINPRFSSLVAARSLCGFRDVEWSIKLALGIKMSLPKLEYKYIRFSCFLHEMVDSPNGYHMITKWCPKM